MKVTIDNEWYDLTKWAPHHPGGQRILERFDGHNATEHFYSLHSAKAIKQFKRMRPVEAKEPVVDESKIDQAFRELREQLRRDGWWGGLDMTLSMAEMSLFMTASSVSSLGG
eukprot:m.32270 g.32270  ORF g.32270 m.32270 type:complete len:112 (-) comp10771_c0_seq2:837-1172(-)